MVVPALDTESLPPFYRAQCEKYLSLLLLALKSAPMPPIPIEPLPNDVLSFAKELLNCPSTDALITRMQQSSEKARARAFLMAAVSLAFDVEKGNVAIKVSAGSFPTPFYVLATLVIERMQLTLNQRGNRWG